MLLDLDRALSSLLPSLLDLAESPPICNDSPGNLPLEAALLSSLGVALLPIGVARFSFGGPALGISMPCDALVSGRAPGDGGIERPSFGIRAELLFLLRSMGGPNNGAGAAMLDAAGGKWRLLLSCATTGNEV